MTTICNRCGVIINGVATTSFMLLGNRVDLCEEDSQQLLDAIFDKDKKPKKEEKIYEY